MRKNTKKSKKAKLLYLFVVVTVFGMAFVLLIKKKNNEIYLKDIKDSSFHIVSEYGKRVVAKDKYAIYPKYYVAYVEDGSYSIYVYNYYDTVSQYNLEFNRLIDKIVDYDINEKMIRYIETKGYGTYDDVLSNLKVLSDNDNLVIY